MQHYYNIFWLARFFGMLPCNFKLYMTQQMSNVVVTDSALWYEFVCSAFGWMAGKRLQKIGASA